MDINCTQDTIFDNLKYRVLSILRCKYMLYAQYFERELNVTVNLL